MAMPISLPLVAALGLLLAACAGKPTPYQPAQGGFGYSEQQTEENRYRVSFAGNSATSRQTVEDYLLYRAAELTVQTGHDWFQVVDRNTVQEDSGYGGSPAFGEGSAVGRTWGLGCLFQCPAGAVPDATVRTWASWCRTARSRRTTPLPTTPSR